MFHHDKYEYLRDLEVMNKGNGKLLPVALSLLQHLIMQSHTSMIMYLNLALLL